MPSQQVIEKLEKLQTELDTVSRAIKHINEAAKVAKTSADILKKISELLAELKTVEEKHHKDLLEDLKEKIAAIEKLLQSLLDDLKDKTNQLSQLIEETKKLEKSITDYFEVIKKINFPERLDKIYNQISSIKIEIGNVQSTIETNHNESKQLIKSLSEATEKHLIDQDKKAIENVERLENKMISLIEQAVSEINITLATITQTLTELYKRLGSIQTDNTKNHKDVIQNLKTLGKTTEDHLTKQDNQATRDFTELELKLVFLQEQNESLKQEMELSRYILVIGIVVFFLMLLFLAIYFVNR